MLARLLELSPLLILILLTAAVVGPLLVWLLARHPVVGCAMIIVAVPLTAGLGRGTIIPVFRVNEVLTVLVASALLLNRLLDRRRGPHCALDVPITVFVVGVVALPALVLASTLIPTEPDTWRKVLGPLEYLVVYLIFSRSQLDGAQRTRLLNLTMATSVVVAVMGLLQAADLFGVRGFLLTYYPRTGPVPGICEFGICRPTSLLEHWSAFGAYALLHYALALALESTEGVQFSRRWIRTVAVVNAVAVIASQTQAAVLGFVLVSLVLTVYWGRVPRAMGFVGASVIVGTALFWSQISARLAQQLAFGQSLTPESLATRNRYWSELFIPIASDRPWFGSGTVISSEVPARLVNFVDSEYLRMVFRGGVVGLALLLMLLVALVVAGLRSRSHSDPVVRALGAALVADIIALAIMGTTAEYLTFSGVSESLWMVAGMLSFALADRSVPSPAEATAQRVGRMVPARL